MKENPQIPELGHLPKRDRLMIPIEWTSVVHGAGGLVWRLHSGRLELLLIRRTRYGNEWSLPKGKVQGGEAWEDAAIREVQEETGCRVEIAGFACGQVYRTGKRKTRPKVVLYWHMRCVAQDGAVDPNEIQELRWVTPEEAFQMLTYPKERRMLEEALTEIPPERIQQWLENRSSSLDPEQISSSPPED